jgi:putative hydrolase of the HAD superfamily
MQSVKAVCLDLDDTLWPVAPAIEAAERAMFEWLARCCPRITERHDVDSMRQVRVRVAAGFPDRRHDLSFLRTESIRALAREAGYPEAVAQGAFEAFYAARNRVELFADVQAGLRRLRARFRLMSLSNGNADLGAIGLASLFEHSIGAREAGAAKPDRRIFEALLERAGLGPEEILYVGDDPHADVEGARRAGLHAAWIDRFGRPWPVELESPAQRIRDLHELADLFGCER